MTSKRTETTWDDGTKVVEWRTEQGLLHRDDGPALIFPLWQQWFQNGVSHRIGAPAIEACDGMMKVWHVNGKEHRLDGPARDDGYYRAWATGGKFHRIDGPAREWNGHPGEWNVMGKKLNDDELCFHLARMIESYLHEIQFILLAAHADYIAVPQEMDDRLFQLISEMGQVDEWPPLKREN